MTPRRPNFYYHLHPPSIPAREARFSYTFGLGGISLALFLLLGITGIFEMFLYVPTAEGAHETIRQITYQAPAGWLLRNIHFWGAQLMVGTVCLHMARVALSGGYKGRRLNWLIGIALLLLTLVLDFSGFVLRWDQDTAWALMVGTKLAESIPWIGPALYRAMVGGESIGSPAILRFYTWHVLGLALPAAILAGWHLFRVRRDGGISHREASPRTDRAQLVRLELIALLLTLAVVTGLSLLVDAPLGPPADPTALVDNPQAPWFFLWIQELLHFGSVFAAGVLVPVIILLVLAGLPFALDRADEGAAVWLNRPGRRLQVVFLLVALVVVVLTVRGALR